MTFDSLTVQMVVSGLLPILLGFVMKSGWSSKLKANVGIIAAAVTAFITNAINQDGVAFVSWDMVQIFILGLVIQIATYNGFYKPATEINDRLPSVVPDLKK